MTEMAVLEPLSDRGSLVDQVRESIYAAISTGKLDPGTRLREIPLSRHFGVSTTPVREALRRLESEGLVLVLPRRGAVVVTMNERIVRDLYDLRLILEVAAARRAVEAESPDLDRVYALMAECERHVDDLESFAEADASLHRAIHDLGGNRELAEMAERVHRRIQTVRVRSAVPGRLRIAQDQHVAIVEALSRRDAAAVETAVRTHLIEAKANVLGYLLGRPVNDVLA